MRDLRNDPCFLTTPFRSKVPARRRLCNNGAPGRRGKKAFWAAGRPQTSNQLTSVRLASA
jgi:hypothetical protein